MIVDRLEHWKKYSALGDRLARALAYLCETDFSALAPGEYAVDEGDILAIVNDYDLKPLSAGRLEGHRRSIDIQYLARGGESIGYSPLGGQQTTRAYDSEADVAFYAGEPTLLRLEEGMFAIFFPQDLHMPGIGETDEDVRKVVMKVRV